MHAKLLYKLQEAMEQFIAKNADTPEYTDEDFFTPANMGLYMARAAACVFDAIVESSKFTEEQVDSD